jgi:hypothetical protein
MVALPLAFRSANAYFGTSEALSFFLAKPASQSKPISGRNFCFPQGDVQIPVSVPFHLQMRRSSLFLRENSNHRQADPGVPIAR